MPTGRISNLWSAILASASAAYRAGIAGADSNLISSPLSGGDHLKEIDSSGSFYVCGRFSALAATCKIHALLYLVHDGQTIFVCQTEATLTAGALSDGSKFASEAVEFKALGANRYEIRAEAPSAGTVDLYTWQA